MTNKAPKLGKKSFICPHCNTFAQQHSYSKPGNLGGAGHAFNPNLPVHTTVCSHCGDFCIWHETELVYPNRGIAPHPNSDMPDDIRKIYEEAASILLYHQGELLPYCVWQYKNYVFISVAKENA